MNNYKACVLTFTILFSPHTLLPSDSLSAPLVTPSPAKTTHISRTDHRCTITRNIIGGCGIGIGLLLAGLVIWDNAITKHPEPTPAPYVHDYFRIEVQSPCSDMCPTYIDRQGMCVPSRAEQLSILKRVGEICPNSTNIQTYRYSVASPTPTPAPCEAVNTTLHQLAITCHPSADLRAELRAKIRPLTEMRRKRNLR